MAKNSSNAKIDRKTALYIRVSTDQQAEEGYSIEAQEKNWSNGVTWRI